MRTNANVSKVIAMLSALKTDRYQTAQDLAGVADCSLEFVYAWCRELGNAGLVEMSNKVNTNNKKVWAWRWKK